MMKRIAPVIRVKQVGGFYFPDDDHECHRAVLVQAPSVDDEWMKWVKGREICVQAGGNCGIYPIRLAQFFASVYTFEPDVANFLCLSLNCTEPNIFKFQSCLGNSHERVNLHIESANVGAHYIEGEGNIPTMMVDDFELPACDLLALDIEGFEFQALSGAQKTIEKFGPTIILEQKGHGKRYGYLDSEIATWLLAKEYRKVGDVCRDQVWVR